MNKFLKISIFPILAAFLLCGCSNSQDARITALEKQNADLSMKIVNMQQDIYQLQNANGILEAKADQALKKADQVNQKEAQTYTQLVDLSTQLGKTLPVVAVP